MQQRPQRLSDLRRLSKSTSLTQEIENVHYESPPSVISKPSREGALPPHMVHHHHFGWGKPQKELPIAHKDGKKIYHKYGDALGYCQNISNKSTSITDREP